MNNNQYESAWDGKTCHIRLRGELRYTESAVFDRYVNSLIADAAFSGLVLDLSETTYMDSTNLGLIAKLMVSLWSRHEKKAVIYCPNHNVAHMITSVGLDEMANLITGRQKKSVDYSHIDGGEERDLNEMMLEAHKTLSDLNEENRLMFKSVVDLLQQAEKEQ